MQLQYNLLKTKFGIEGDSWKEKRIGGIENGYIYDVHITTKGEIWFKIPMTEK